MTKSASLSIGAATSSVSIEVPLGRAAPPEAKKPLRTSQSAWTARLVGREVDLGRALALEDRDALRDLDLQRLRRRRRDVDQHRRRGLGEVRHAAARSPAGARTVASARRSMYSAAVTPVVVCTPPLASLRDGAGAGIGIGEDDEVGRLVRMLVDGAVGHLGDEAERALRADDQVDQDVDRVVEIDQRIDRIADGVLDPVFLPDQRDELLIGHHLVMQRCERSEQRRHAMLRNAATEAGSPVSSTVPSTSITRSRTMVW